MCEHVQVPVISDKPVSITISILRCLFRYFKDQKRYFYHYGRTVKLVQTCFEDLESSFHHHGSLMKLVQNCLSARGDLESSFCHCAVFLFEVIALMVSK